MRWLCLRAAALAALAISMPAAADFVIQVGAYTRPIYAIEKIEELKAAGFPVFQEPAVDENRHRPLTHVLVGPYSSLAHANAAKGRLTARGQAAFVRNYVPPVASELDEGTQASAGPPETTEGPPPASVMRPGAAPAPLPIPGGDRVDTMPRAEEGHPPTVSSLGRPVGPGRPREPESLEDLFGLAAPGAPEAVEIQGTFRSELAYITPRPAHLSKFRNSLELGFKGRWGHRSNWLVSGRVAYDAVFELDDFFPAAVRDDQRTEAMLRETYIDYSVGDWDFRLGRQHIIWGETVGLFFADVVSARDLRESVLPDFDYLRIPQWAARAEYFRGDFHGELLWIPYQSLDNIGVPGADFYPYPPPPPAGYAYLIADERRPARTLENAPYGARVSYVRGGWDLSAFYYRSVDVSPTFYRRIVTTPVPAYVYTPDHDKIRQWGGTLSKDFYSAVMKAELIYTKDRAFNVDRISDPDGVVKQDFLDYVVSVEYALPADSRLNLQFFQRLFADHDPAIVPEESESGVSLFASGKAAGGRLELELLWIASLNRTDWLASPELTWFVEDRWQLVFGADIFHGGQTGLFGRYDQNDRVYTEARYLF